MIILDEGNILIVFSKKKYFCKLHQNNSVVASSLYTFTSFLFVNKMGHEELEDPQITCTSDGSTGNLSIFPFLRT